MIAIADGGSSKCDWLLYDGNQTSHTGTRGYNPLFLSPDEISNDLLSNDLLRRNAEYIEKVFFYGASCSSPALQEKVKKGLSVVFQAADICVRHDLDGAVFATCQGSPGIACILGTGANCAMWDGNALIQETPALGYILGDEGSGAFFGKLLLSRWLYRQLPLHLEKAFLSAYPGLGKDEVIDQVYSKPGANFYLASFMLFLSQFKTDEYIQDMIRMGFSRFIDIHVWRYRGYRDLPVHFVGSVAHVFQDTLRQAAKSHRLHLGRIMQRPIEGLAQYHGIPMAAG